MEAHVTKKKTKTNKPSMTDLSLTAKSLGWKDLKDDQFPSPLSQAGLPGAKLSTRAGFPGPHPIWS